VLQTRERLTLCTIKNYIYLLIYLLTYYTGDMWPDSKCLSYYWFQDDLSKQCRRF